MTTIETLDQCLETVKAMRVLRFTREYPLGHSESPRRPEFVRAWEAKHGPAPASAERYLEALDE